MLLEGVVDQCKDTDALNEARQCPNCGRALATGNLAGLCPTCLLDQGAEGDNDATGSPSRFTPPSIEAVAKLFPHLEILGLIGAGGMGAVYKARQPVLDRLVALKILASERAGSANFADRFNREARALAKLSHPNIVGVHEFGQVGGLHFFVMEFVNGTNLRQLERTGRISPKEALQIVPQICEALQYAHDQGVVHRDIKPENVLVDRQGQVKIADFGLAKMLGPNPESTRLTGEGHVMGTPHYMAPEQLERPLTVDHRADIFSLGVVLYEMLTGELPIGNFSPPSRRLQLDVRLDDVLLRALENDPVRRYQNVSEVRTDLEIIASAPNGEQAPPASAILGPERQVRGIAGKDGKPKKHFNFAFAVTASCLAIGVVTATGLGLRSIRAKRNLQAADTPLPLTNLLQSHPTAGAQSNAASKKTGFEQWNPTRIASIDPETGALVATFPGGGSQGILAIADAAKPTEWWRPDGSPVTNEIFEVMGETPQPSSGRDVLVLVSYATNSIDGTELLGSENLDPPARLVYSSSVRRNGTLDNIWASRLIFPDSAKTATYKCRTRIEPVRNFSTLDPHRGHVETTPREGDPAFEIMWWSHDDTQDGLKISTMVNLDPEFWLLLVTGVDTNGAHHRPGRYGGGFRPSMGKSALFSFTFDSLQLSAVKELRAELQPVEFLEFHGIALYPTTLAATTATKRSKLP